MVARLIHRHAAADRLFPGAFPGGLADLVEGDVAILAVDAVAGLAVRDAAFRLDSKDGTIARTIDLGNLRAASLLPETLREIGQRDARPLMLGGDAGQGTEFVATSTQSAAIAPPGVILLSPRLDIRLPETAAPAALAIGAQRLVSRRNYLAWRDAGGTVLPASAVEVAGMDAALQDLACRTRTALLMVDLAVVDTGYAAGASLRNVGGLSPMAAIDIAEQISSRFDIRGLALLNLAPERDPRGHSERIAATIARLVVGRADVRQAA
jgi:arginase family enzyme